MPFRSTLPRAASWSLLLLNLAQPAFPAADPYIAVIEKAAGAVGFYSVDGNLLGTVKVGSFPHEGALSSDGRFLYVSDNGVLWMTEDANGTNTISVVDVRAMKRTAVINLGRFHRPHGIALVPGSGNLIATTERPFGLVLVDPVARKVIRDYQVKGKSPHMVIPHPNGQWVYASNADSDSVAAVELSTGDVTVIPTAARPQGGVLSHDSKRLYMTCSNGNQISIIDTGTKRVVGSIATGKGPGRIAIAPDGRTLVYNLQMEPGVGFADIPSGRQTTVIPLPGRPLSLTTTSDGKRAFAGVQDQDKVFFISIPERRIERVIETPKGSGPDPAIPLPRH